MAAYEKTLLVYLDIMGFKDLINDSATDPAKIDLIINTLRQMKRQAGIRMPGILKTKTKTQNFSDLIVRATYPQSDPHLIQQISAECWLLAAVQCDLVVSNGVLLRGGMCLNDLYMDEDIVFGPALVTSYQLGEHVAMFPRIVIDPIIMNSIKLPETDLLDVFIARGEDGAYFLDYLYVCFMHPTIVLGIATPANLLAAHKERAERKLIELSEKGDRTKQKGLWLALYHNSVVNRLIRKHRSMKPKLLPLLITEEKLRI